ncbi:MAG: hypothetical protein ACOX8U_05270, partial [Bradymonadia bacterium]
ELGLDMLTAKASHQLAKHLVLLVSAPPPRGHPATPRPVFGETALCGCPTPNPSKGFRSWSPFFCVEH